MDSGTIVSIVGTVAHEPRLRRTRSGEAVVTLRMATRHLGREGRTRTEWHRLVLRGEDAEHAVRTLRRGDSISVTGRQCTPPPGADTNRRLRFSRPFDGLPSSTPPCAECGDATIRSGACFLCTNCGSTTGCS